MAAIELGTYLQGTGAERYHDCIEACVQCVIACEVCAEGCLRSEDVNERLDCIRLCRDTTELPPLGRRVPPNRGVTPNPLPRGATPW